MKICKIADKIKKETGAGYILRETAADAVFAEFCPDSWEGYKKIADKAEHMRGVHVERFMYSRVVRVWLAEDYARWEKHEAEKKSLVNGFWETLHNFGREAAGKYFNDHAADYARLGI